MIECSLDKCEKTNPYFPSNAIPVEMDKIGEFSRRRELSNYRLHARFVGPIRPCLQAARLSTSPMLFSMFPSFSFTTDLYLVIVFQLLFDVPSSSRMLAGSLANETKETGWRIDEHCLHHCRMPTRWWEETRKIRKKMNSTRLLLIRVSITSITSEQYFTYSFDQTNDIFHISPHTICDLSNWASNNTDSTFSRYRVRAISEIFFIFKEFIDRRWMMDRLNGYRIFIDEFVPFIIFDCIITSKNEYLYETQWTSLKSIKPQLSHCWCDASFVCRFIWKYWQDERVSVLSKHVSRWKTNDNYLIRARRPFHYRTRK